MARQTEFSKAVEVITSKINNFDYCVEEPDIRDLIDEVCGEIDALMEEQQDKFSNMPQSLQQGPTGELIEERRAILEEWSSELNALDITKGEDESVDDYGARIAVEISAITPEY